jgi:cytochrome c oxidase subunit 2
MNAIPGDVNTAPIQARQGTYYGQCTELCGVGHAQMTFVVIGLPMNQFQSCVFGNPSGSIDPTSKSCTLGGS